MSGLNLFSLIDLFLPRLCPGCGQSLSRGEEELCINCLATLPETGFCEKPENPVNRKFIGRFKFEYAAACYYFHKSSTVQHIIHHFKYKNRRKTALFMGRQMGAILKDTSIEEAIDGIVPVPLHSRKERKRGYNQSKLLGDGISEVLEIPVYSKLLKRISYTQTQTKLNAVQRWQNVKDVFKVSNKSKCADMHLLLVDDVVTSGATLEACARELSKLENVKVSMIALAAASH